MITPRIEAILKESPQERGRKLCAPYTIVRGSGKVAIERKSPRKGTKTIGTFADCVNHGLYIIERKSPRKGTKTVTTHSHN